MSDKWNAAQCLEGLALAAALQGQAERTARLLGVADGLHLIMDAPIPPVERPDYERCRTLAESELGPERFAAAWIHGQALFSEGAESGLANLLRTLTDESTKSGIAKF